MERVINRVLMVYASGGGMAGLENFLKGSGYEVDNADSGADAVSMAAAAPYEAILMDFRTAVAEEILDACKRIKANPGTMYVPIMLASNEMDHGDRIAVLNSGADDILLEPVDPYEVVARLRSFRRLCVRAREILRKEEMIDRHNGMLRAILGTYVTPEIAEDLIRNPEKREMMGGETRTVTAMFADIRNFTDFSASHEPSEVVALVNEIFEAMVGVIFSFRGTLDNFMGDCVMAFWGAPRQQDDHALRAVCCAFEMQKRMAEIRDCWKKDEYYKLGLGIGINTGEVLVGSIGHSRFRKYTAIGSAINIAARLEKFARRDTVLISENTHALIKPHVITESFPVELKGISGPVTAHNMLKVKHPVAADQAVRV